MQIYAADVEMNPTKATVHSSSDPDGYWVISVDTVGCVQCDKTENPEIHPHNYPNQLLTKVQTHPNRNCLFNKWC